MDQPAPGRDAAGGGLLLLLLAPVSAFFIVRLGWYRLASSPTRRAVLPPELALGGVALMLLFGALGALAAVRGLGIDPSATADRPALREQALITLGAYLGQAAVPIAYVIVLRLRRGRDADPERRPSIARALLIGALAIVLCWPIVNAVGWLTALVTQWLGGGTPDVVSHETLRMLLESPMDASFVLMTLLVVIGAPVLEEFLYRGLLQDAFRRLGMGPWPAIAVVSVIFAAMHWQNTAPHAVAGLFVLSLGFGWAYERTGRLSAAIAMHVLFNVGNLAVALAAS